MSNENNNGGRELHTSMGDAAALVRAYEAGDGPGVAALVAGLDPEELGAVVMMVASLVPAAWRAAYRAGVRFGSLNVPDHELDDFSESDELAGLSAAELAGYLGAVTRTARESS
ncbi:hypothetical protein ACTXPX_05915 [Glutamicibacter arilaitensis]|uniref:hypothetical protein n=1 Tax=Glutamicibacter arilaitensis TaxID=256701 RepID=UPI001865D6AC|nr:hypothetical protein [Glutamicibacter arilaitensis]